MEDHPSTLLLHIGSGTPTHTMYPTVTNATLGMLSLIGSPRFNTTAVSLNCMEDVIALREDPTLLAAVIKLNVDESLMAIAASIQCGIHSKPCQNERCCQEAFDWSSHRDDLQMVAKAIDKNENVKKACFTNMHATMQYGSIPLGQEFEHAGLLLVGRRCTKSDVTQLLANFSDEACGASPSLRDCKFSLSSPSCGGGDGPCTDYQTMGLIWPKCDAPSDHTEWSIDLNTAFGPECSASARSGCCYIALGYDHGPPFGSSCLELCSQLSRKGDDDAYCSKSDGSKYGNCFCSSVLT